MSKEKVEFIFIVLTYRNCNDLKNFISSVLNIKSYSYKIICINSYFDNESMTAIKKICYENNCDFYNIKNKGYGYGNNKGIKIACQKYNFKYLVISNPDIVIKKFKCGDLSENFIYAPMIITKQGRQQNPFRLPNNRIIDLLKYKSFKNNIKFFIYTDILINKIYRTIYNFLKLESYINSCHGSFFIIGNKALKTLGFPLFNEEVFLFTEEEHIAMLAKCKNIKIKMNRDIQVLHKEDGSMDFLSLKNDEIARNSYIKFFNFWYK